MSFLPDELASPAEIVRALGTVPRETWTTRKYPHLYAASLCADADANTIALPGCSWPCIIVNVGEPYGLRYTDPLKRQRECRMDPNFVHLIPAGQAGLFELSNLENKTAQRIVLAMDPEWLRRFVLDHTGSMDVGRMTFFLGRDEKTLATAVTALYRALQEPQPMTSLFVDSAAQFIAASVLRDHCNLSESPFTTVAPRRRLKRVLDYIHENYTADIQLAELADEAGLSAFHFSRVFKEATGMSPRQYVIKLRMDEACRLLKKSSLDVLEISSRVGYESVSHFSSLFKRHMGISPAAYRKS